MNMKISYTLKGELGQVICFKPQLAAQIIANLAMKGATDIHIIGKRVEKALEDDTAMLVEKFRIFLKG